MNAVEQFLTQLQGQLRVRGAARRRVLRECRDHLEDAAAQVGPQEAVRRFGAPDALAAAFDIEVAAGRTQRSTAAACVGVLAVAASTLALVNGASAGASAVPLWAVVFFAAAQTAAVSAVLAAVQAAGMRHAPAAPADMALLCRRNAAALMFAALTLFAAGAAVPGQGGAVSLLAGPTAAGLAIIAVLRTRSLVRRLPSGRSRVRRLPLTDVAAILAPSTPNMAHRTLLLPSTLLATASAFVWDHTDGGTATSSLTSASIEAALVIAGYLALGPALGLRPSRHGRRPGAEPV